MSDLWHRAFLRALTLVYYHRVRVVGGEHRPARGPVLYVGLHRNGAVDGMVYKRACPRATFLVAARLLRSPFRRVFFAGIPVERAKDGGDRSGNDAALDRCVAHLAAGGELFVLPEGTSDLGPRHLPFAPGAARILARALAAGVPVAVVPVAIFYDAPERFRSDVTIVFGAPVDTALSGTVSERGRVATLMRRLTTALEGVGMNVADAPTLDRVERLAALAAGEPGPRYAAALKALERSALPRAAGEAWARLEWAIATRRLAAHRGVPLFSRRGALWSAAWLGVQLPVVAAATLANLPVLLASWAAGRRLADARNTVALWRMLVGAPVATLWLATVATTALATGHGALLAAYAALTVAGLFAWPELGARRAKLRNALAAPALARDARAVAAWVNACASAHAVQPEARHG